MADWMKNAALAEEQVGHLVPNTPSHTYGSPATPQHMLVNFAAAPDNLFDSKRVYKLTRSNFDSFLRDKEVAKVFFYSKLDQNTMSNAWEFNKSSKAAARHSHAYAAVNCALDSYFCEDQDIEATPMFRLYSRGQVVGAMKHPNDPDFQDIIE